MPKFRVIVLEDSITGDSKIIVKENGKFRKITIGELIDWQIKKNGYLDIDGREKAENKDNLEIFSVNKEGKIILAKPSKFVRHKNSKQIYEITTTSGRKIKVTEDHSLFSLDEKNIIKPIKVGKLREREFLAIPMNLPFNNCLEKINLLEYSEKLNKKIFVFGEGIESYIEKNKKELRIFAKDKDYKKGTVQNWIRKKLLPVNVFRQLKEKIENKNLFVKGCGNSTFLPFEINLDEDLLNFFGLWLADGCYDKHSIIITVQEEENREIVRKIAERFKINLRMHTDGFSLILNSSLFKEVMQKVFEFYGNSYTKKIPCLFYNLSENQIGWLLRGFFDGESCVSDKEIIFSVRSKELVEDVSTFLLRFGIVSRNSMNLSSGSYLKEKKEMFHCRIGATKDITKFKKKIGFLIREKQKKLEKLCSRISTHDTSDIVPLSSDIKNELAEILGNKFSKQDYITRQNNLGREHLSKLLDLIPEGITNPIGPLKKIVKSEIFWDKIKKIRKVDYEGYVYDISVPKFENFISENIVAHNTLELPVESLRKLGYDILRMKVRSALLQTTTEIAADEGIRTSLRFGDSCLIVGEVRSLEAKALFEAMRVGALANVVMGTIHGASPYAVFDRVVNDLGVPVTSFKATDIVMVANPVKSASGLQSWRRVVQLAEVRKHWTKDPEEEKGFVDLLKYNVERDELEPSDELINGDSEIIKNVASNVKGWAGNWDAVYDNILLRGKIKEELLDISEKIEMPEILESKFNSLCNSSFYEISDKVRKEIGLPLSERVFPLWQEWLKKEARKIKTRGRV